jgi:hypothetical protein
MIIMMLLFMQNKMLKNFIKYYSLDFNYSRSAFLTIGLRKKDENFIFRNRELFNKFKLLYCSSRDGIGTGSYRGATIWVAKIKDSTQLIGGYNPLDWNGGKHQIALILQLKKIFLLQY